MRNPLKRSERIEANPLPFVLIKFNVYRNIGLMALPRPEARSSRIHEDMAMNTIHMALFILKNTTCYSPFITNTCFGLLIQGMRTQWAWVSVCTLLLHSGHSFNMRSMTTTTTTWIVRILQENREKNIARMPPVDNMRFHFHARHTNLPTAMQQRSNHQMSHRCGHHTFAFTSIAARTDATE